MNGTTPAAPSLTAGRYLITGGGGFIGSHFRSRVLAAGGEVVHLDLVAPRVMSADERFVRCDLTDPAAVRGAFKGLHLDGVLHAAARVGDWGRYDQFAKINVDGTRHVLDAALGVGARRVVCLSSIAAMGLDTREAADHTDPLIAAGDAYSVTKAEGERVARSFQAEGAPVVVFRPGDVYGVGSVPWVLRPLEMLRRRQLLLVDGGRGHFAHTHVENLVDAVSLAMQHDRANGKVWVLTDGDTGCTMGQYFTRLAEVTGLPAPSRAVPRTVAHGVGFLLEHLAALTGKAPPITRAAVAFMGRRGSFSIEPVKAELGWSPRVSYNDGMAELGRTYREASR